MNIINKPISPSSTKTCSSSSFSQMNHSPADYKVDIPPAMEAPAVIMSPCAACKILRRRCVEKCVLAPYFPPTDPLKFTIAHRVFGASNIIKFLQELPESQRADAVSSMVYEANARVREPVYGCAGVIFQLQKQVSELQAELAKSQAEIVNMQCQQSNLLALFCMDFSEPHNNHQSITSSSDDLQQQQYDNLNFFQDHDVDLSSIMEPLWT